MDDWKLKYKHGMLLIWPPTKVRNLVNKLRSKYDPSSQKICEAHITLTQPFLEKPNAFAWKIVNKTLREFPKFKIFFGPIETFKSTSVIKFRIKPQKTLSKLRANLHKTGLFDLSLPFTKGFIAHMTISEFGINDPKKAREIAKDLNKKIDEGSFICNNISYIRPNKAFHFTIQKSLSFKK